MSAIGARHMMRHRCDVIRDANLGQVDELENELAPDWQPHLADQPCYMHSDFRSGFSGEFKVGEGRAEVTRTLYRLMVPRDADILTTDEISEVRDKRGQPLYSGGFLQIDNFEFAEFYKVFYLTEQR